MSWICERFQGDKTLYYWDEPIVLDTETSHVNDKTWISSIQVLFEDNYYFFRKPSELMDWYKKIIIYVGGVNSYHRLVTIIHNASYDLSYLIPYIQLELPNKEDRTGIYESAHKIKMYRQGGLEFRDTYILSQCSLEKWSKDLNVEHQKQVGLYDYSKVIYQDTELNEDELKYDKYDVLCLYECYKKQMELDHDTICTVPYTSTGYVRRDFRKASRHDKNYRRKYFINTALDVEKYKYCVNSYAGGFTHNNRFLKSETHRKLVGHRDFRSHYPSQMRVSPLPFGAPKFVYDFSKDKVKWNIQDVLELYPEYSTISKIYIEKAVLRNKDISMPFFQYSKLDFYSEEGLKETLCIKDNGRIINFEGAAYTYIDNHTLKIISEQYRLEYVIVKVLAFKNEYMPQCLAECIDYYFKMKDNLKREVKRCEKEYGKYDPRTIEAAINLQKMKGRLNGIYGMFATNPLYDFIDIDFEEEQPFIEKAIKTDDEVAAALDRFYHSKNSFLPYQVGVFITALARYELYEYILAIGYKNVLYCDTDSIFYFKDDEVEKRIEELNKIKNKQAESLDAYIVNDLGKKVYYDVFEAEDDIYAFRGLHSKCYAYECYDKKQDEIILVSTIAGIPARTLVGFEDGKPKYTFREEELGNIDHLYDGFEFHVCTGTTCEYNITKPQIITINGHEIETAGGAIIKVLDDKVIADLDNTCWEVDSIYEW